MEFLAGLGRTLFGADNALAWWQECDRAALVTLYGLVAVRVGGRRIFGKWSALDVVVSIVIGSNLSRTLTGGAPLAGTLAATTLILVLHYVLTTAAARSPWFSRLVEGTPLQLARDGEIDPAAMRAEAISDNDLFEALRGSEVERVEETRLVMLEPSGKITVLKRGK